MGGGGVIIGNKTTSQTRGTKGKKGNCATRGNGATRDTGAGRQGGQQRILRGGGATTSQTEIREEGRDKR